MSCKLFLLLMQKTPTFPKLSLKNLSLKIYIFPKILIELCRKFPNTFSASTFPIFYAKFYRRTLINCKQITNMLQNFPATNRHAKWFMIRPHHLFSLLESLHHNQRSESWISSHTICFFISLSLAHC